MRRALMLMTAAALVAGCGGEEGTATYIRASFDGHVWSADAQPGMVVYSVDFPDGGGQIFVIASREVGKGSQFISLNLPIPPEVGSYPLDGATTRVAYASCPDDVLADCIFWSSVAEHPGTLTIDHLDPTTGIIEGDFTFTGYALGNVDGSTKGFTSGHFRISAPGIFMLD